MGVHSVYDELHSPDRLTHLSDVTEQQLAFGHYQPKIYQR